MPHIPDHLPETPKLTWSQRRTENRTARATNRRVREQHRRIKTAAERPGR